MYIHSGSLGVGLGMLTGTVVAAAGIVATPAAMIAIPTETVSSATVIGCTRVLIHFFMIHISSRYDLDKDLPAGASHNQTGPHREDDTYHRDGRRFRLYFRYRRGPSVRSSGRTNRPPPPSASCRVFNCSCT